MGEKIMTNKLPEDPFKIILEINQKTLLCLEQINRIVNNQSDTKETSNKNKGAQTESLNEWFSISTPQINHALAQKFFPALIESMAGSDAICIKGMTNNYTNSSKNLDRQWQLSIYKAIKQNPPVLPEQIKNWVDEYRETLNLCNDEIIPMADRLLDGMAIQELGLYFGRLHKNIFK